MHPKIKAAIYLGLKQLKRSGFHQNLKFFRENQYKPYETLKVQQERLLVNLLQEAYQGVPAYRTLFDEAKVLYNGNVILSNFEELPPLTRMDIVFKNAEYTHEKARERGMYYFKTGGSTGTPVQIGQDHHYRDWSMASTSFFYEWQGMTLGTPYFILWAAQQDLHAQLSSRKDQFLMGFLQGRRILNCRMTSPDLWTSFIHRLNTERDCHYLVGYANELYSLACHSLEYNLPIERPFKAIFATAATLTERMRETIESVFHTRVYNRYGCRDAGDLACECEQQNGLHINPLYTYIEVADEDGKPLPYGEEGQILVTNLHNHAMPLIRYAVGDQGILRTPEPCACGRFWPSLEQVTGRTSEKLFLPGGTRFGGAFLHTAFDDLPYLKRYQIHQLSETRLLIKLRSPIQKYTENYVLELQRVADRFCTWTGHPLTVTFEQTDEFDKTPTGKELIIVHKQESLILR